jgi:hypothetical protein
VLPSLHLLLLINQVTNVLSSSTDNFILKRCTSWVWATYRVVPTVSQCCRIKCTVLCDSDATYLSWTDETWRNLEQGPQAEFLPSRMAGFNLSRLASLTFRITDSPNVINTQQNVIQHAYALRFNISGGQNG